MDFKDAIKELGVELKQFFSSIQEPVKEQKFMDYKLEDGTIIRSDNGTLEVGAAISVITEEGEAPIPDGEYMIPSETETIKIKVEGGFVTEKEAMPMEGEAPTDAPVEEAVDMEAKVNALFEAKMAEFNQAIEAKFAEFLNVYESDKAKFNEGLTGLSGKYDQSYKVIQALNEFVQKVGGQPTAQPTANQFGEQRVKKAPKPFDMDAWRREQGLA